MQRILLTIFIFLMSAGVAQAHFGMVIPSASTVTSPDQALISLQLFFSHPMAMQGMPLARPAFSLYKDGQKEDLKLSAIKIMENDAWKAEYRIKAPGVYQFVMEPQPYWEPAEDCFIIHYTKIFVAAFGEEEGWDEPLGLKTEIVPLTRPFANYAGNVFQGQVLQDGKVAPGAIVEVEFYNKDKKHTAPNDYFVTQVVKADANGVFSYSAPWAGWWGFAALHTSAEKLPHAGVPKDVELGAVLWVEFTNPK